jgi:hypothetical protein
LDHLSPAVRASCHHPGMSNKVNKAELDGAVKPNRREKLGK